MGYLILTTLLVIYLAVGVGVAGRSVNYWAGLAWQKHPGNNLRSHRLGFVNRQVMATSITWPKHLKRIRAHNRKELER